jgi:pimeloyl-ACP methyl ester carboxylesterase
MHPMNEPSVQFLPRPDGSRLAYALRRAARSGAPGFVWMGGFHSEMTATKATALDAWAQETGAGLLRFDWFGHGRSDGAFEDGTITRWIDDGLAALDALTNGPQVLVGSSMGAWMALHAALARPERVAGLVLIAPAPDFTEDLMWAEFPEEVRVRIMETGSWPRPSAYGEAPYPITRGLIESGRRHLLLRGPIAFSGPVRILHGQRDPDVPWGRSLDLMERLTGEDVEVRLVKDGDHRLSSPRGLALLRDACAEFLP